MVYNGISLVVPMSIGSVFGAFAGSYLAPLVATDTLRVFLAGALALSAIKPFSSSKLTRSGNRDRLGGK